MHRCAQPSFLSADAGEQNYRGFFNLAGLILVVSNLRHFLQNFRQYGWLISLPLGWFGPSPTSSSSAESAAAENAAASSSANEAQTCEAAASVVGYVFGRCACVAAAAAATILRVGVICVDFRTSPLLASLILHQVRTNASESKQASQPASSPSARTYVAI